MSRTRNIKPGFFENETLAECSPLARLLFIALWCEADREGRLEDRPKRIKAKCLPYDACDADELLNELERAEFITRYEVVGSRYIQIDTFAKHQNPHQRELASVIPGKFQAEPNLGTTQAQPNPEQDEDCTGSAGLSTSSLIPQPSSNREIEAHEATSPISEAAVAMRKAGVPTLNQSNPDFLKAIEEGVTPSELANAVADAKGRGINGAGLFTYAISIARTNHAKAASEIRPQSRAGPGRQSGGKVMGLLQTLEGMKDGLDQPGISNGLPDAGYARLGGPARG